MSPDFLSDDALVRVSNLVNQPGKPGLTGISRTSLYRLIAAGQFPRPVRPMPGVVAWHVGTVRAWLHSHAAA